MGGLVLAATLIPPAGVAALFGEQIQLFGLLAACGGTAIVSGSILILTPKPRRPARPSDGLAVLLLWWLLAPIAVAPAFLLGVDEQSIIAALHEAVSSLTTTGHSVIDIADDPGWPQSLIVLRTVLHALGAVASVSTAASVFAALNLGGPGIHRSVLFSIPEGSFFDALPRVIIASATVFAALTCTVFLALLLSGDDPADALARAFSVSSTGLVDPTATPEGLTRLHSLILFVGLFMSAVGLTSLVELRAARFRTMILDPELLALGVAWIAAAAMGIAVGLGAFDAVGWAISTLSTSGLIVTDTRSISALPTSIAILPALVGGSALSAAGGVKLARVVILTRRASREFARLGYQDSVVALRFRGRAQDERAIIGVWVYLTAYVAAVTSVLIALSTFGSEFDAAVRSAVGAISNTGSLIAPPANTASHLVLIAAMLLGRWEVLALLPALRPSFWRA